MSQVFFIGDLHLGHVNIAKFRPEFSSGEEHDEYVKKQIRKCFGKRNIIWLLGDTIFHVAHEDFMNEVCENFQHVHNVLGNHCTEQTMREDIQRRLYAKHPNYHIHGMVSKYGFWLSHAPIHPNELRGKHGVLHGHVHADNIDDGRYLNLSAESINYTPMTLLQIRQHFNVDL